MRQSTALLALVAAAATSVFAAEIIECNENKQCPESAPCCGQYYQCGTGAFCLGGCDPRGSFSLDACMPAPVCEDRKLKLNSLDTVKDISEYLGDPSEADWVASGEPALNKGNVILTMPRQSYGTVLSSTAYMWYGNVKARMRTSRGRGVVTAFIFFSDVKDEIDYEFVGVDLEMAQTNYYFQGITNYENSGNISLSNTFSDWHNYEINWTPDKIEWLIDGKVGRTVQRKDTWNKTANRWEFPQTPSRVQLSLWPAGDPKNPKGTVDWAGGEIDWDHEDIKNAGFFYTTISDVEMTCYKGDGKLGSRDGTSYTYSSTAATNDTVVVGKGKTMMASLSATGLDTEKGGKKDDDKKDDKKDDKEEKAPPSVPGGGAGGNKETENQKTDSGDSGNGGNGGNSGNSDSGSDNSAGDASSAGGSANCPIGEFGVDCDGNGNGNGNGDSSSSKSSASLLAIVIAGCALYWL
jgi:beta-glucanase (GH16 family)